MDTAPARPPGAPQRLVARLSAPLTIAAGAVVLWVISGVGFANYDTLYALTWGGQLARGETPQYGIPIAPTPHPLVEALGVVLSPLSPSAIEGVTAETVSNAALAGDSFANEILETAADHLAIWFGGIVDLLEPERIVVGGGFAKVMMRYAPRIHKTLRVWAINPNRKRARIVKAHFQAQSALVGAAALWLPRTDTRK